MKKKSLSLNKLKSLSREVAALILEISYKAKAGHVGSALSISDLVSVLYFSEINITKNNLTSQNRDRFILSKGHAAAALYSVLYKKGIISKNQLFSFGQNGGLCEHPEIHDLGVEMSTGSLGHGLAFGVGIALGAKKSQSESRTWVLISDGECGEGSVWEAALLASRLMLNNLTAILDYNKWQCFGDANEITNLDPLAEKWKSFGWNVIAIDGHDIAQIKNAYQKANNSSKKPSIIIANTISGNGVSAIENKLVGHYKVFAEEEYKKANKEIMDL